VAKNTVFSKKSTLNINGNLLTLTTPKIMGIINVTPDSFYSGSRKSGLQEALDQADQMVKDGATFLDIGGYSSRPGAKDISIQEEVDRTAPIIAAIKKKLPDVYISIDTFRSGVAKTALESGAEIINDISGGELDPDMFDLVAKSKAPYIMMHMKGTPQNMVTKTDYSDLLKEVLDYFQNKLDALHKKGAGDIILDPGFGFAKDRDQNFALLRELRYFDVLEQPILIGVSRKSMIYKTLGTSPDQALNGTSVLNTIGLLNGANILRVHDVKEAAEVVKLVELTYN